MSLIKCPECGKQVSDQANACPDCGYPIKANNTKGKVAIKIANGLAGTVKIYNVDDYKNVLLWQESFFNRDLVLNRVDVIDSGR